MANVILETIILSILPISELRGGIPFAVANGLSVYNSFLISVLANIAVIFAVFLFLDNVHKYFLRIKVYNSIFNKYIDKIRVKLENKVGTNKEALALYLLVAVPLPLTGAYTGSILAWLFNIKRKKAYLSIILGVVTAGVIVAFISEGIISLF